MIAFERIRQSRRLQKLSLENISERTGLSGSYLSQVERGIVNPSLSALGKLAEALDIPITSLLKQENESQPERSPYTVINPEQRHKLIYPGSNVANEMLTPTLNQEFEFFWTSIAPGQGSRDEPYDHVGYECGLIIQGTIEFYIGDDKIILKAGQSICFDPTVPHYWKNIGDCDVHAVWVISPSPFSFNRNGNE